MARPGHSSPKERIKERLLPKTLWLANAESRAKNPLVRESADRRSNVASLI